jgi:hypothetical protein
MNIQFFVLFARITAFLHGLIIMYLISTLLVQFLHLEYPDWYLFPTFPILCSQLILGNCPLSMLENYFLKLAKKETLGNNGFISHYVKKITKVSIPVRIIDALTGLIAGIVLFYYFF